MVPSERTVTVGVGHGKKAARADRRLAARARARERAEARAGRRSTSCISGTSATPPAAAAGAVRRRAGQRTSPRWSAGSRSRRRPTRRGRCLSCGNCFECDGCLGACPEDAVIKLGVGLALQVRLRPLHRLRRVLRAVPRACDRDGRARTPEMAVTVDGNEAAASVAYRLNEVCCIYPITPSSPMAELADEWSSQGRPNVWGSVPSVVEMQSEGGAAGALHGALQSGALATTFTASQGLLLMIPNMYKIAGELTPAVIHVAARSLATQGLSIFGDHSDVMAVRQTGFAMLASSSVQEAHDLALVAQAATLRTRVPFVHFFDGFRTSHELNTIELLSDDDLRALVPEELVRAHRGRALSPERPFIRGTAQNPDVYFQARETVNPFYARVPGAVEEAMAGSRERTGRRYHLVDYAGHPEAERVARRDGVGRRDRARDGGRADAIAASASASCSSASTARSRRRRCSRRCPRPCGASPSSTGPRSRARSASRSSSTRSRRSRKRSPTASARRCRGSSGAATGCPRRSSLPAWSRASSPSWRRSARVAASRSASPTTSRERASTTTPTLDIEPPETVRAIFFGLGSDGTVGANKNTIKILGAEDGMHAQGYFVYDSKKSGSQTVSHLRFGPEPIQRRLPRRSRPGSSAATSSACSTAPTSSAARRPARRCCSTARYPAGRGLGRALPRRSRSRSSPRASISTSSTPAGSPARPGCRAASTPSSRPASSPSPGCSTREQAIERIKAAIAKTYGRRGAEIVERNQAAVDQRPRRACTGSKCPTRVTAVRELPPLVPAPRARVRPHRHRRDARRARRRPAGQRAARGRDIPERHGRLREAQHLRSRRCLGRRPVHPVRQLQLRVPPQRDPLEVLRRGAPRRVARDASSRRRSTLSACPTRTSPFRSTSRTAPAAASASRPARSRPPPTPVTRRSTSCAASRCVETERDEHRVLRDASGNRSVASRLRHRPRHPVPGAAVRVLGRVRRLRRDALPQAPLAALRRPADGGQRDRLLVDLRRQPADHAVDDRRRRARAGLVELALRGQRRVRARLPARRRPPHRPRPPPPRRVARRSRRRARRRDPRAPQLRESELQAQRAAGRGADPAPRRARGPGASPTC